MKYLLLFFVMTGGYSSFAQHCPYDGSSLIAVRLLNEKGELISPEKNTVFLMEIDNPDADYCTYATGLLKKELMTTTGYLVDCEERYNSPFGKELVSRLEKTVIVSNANLMIGLNQAETSCMISQDGDFVYKIRKFVIVYSKNNIELRVAVPPNAICSLCTGKEDLKNIKPVTLKF